jgi:hypothetical protein
MIEGGSLFWKSFTEKVADEVTKHKFARLIDDLKKLDIYDQLNSCSYCFLPTNGSRCSFCKKVYCDRSYYCQGDKLTGIFSNNCDSCDACHTCDICKVRVTFPCCNLGIPITGKHFHKCEHTYCILHEKEKARYKCLICETEQN